MWRSTWLVFSQAVTVAVAVLFVVLTLKPDWLPRGAGLGRTRLALPAPTLQLAAATAGAASGASSGATGPGYALAARRAAPAVVSVTATKMTRRNPHAEDPRFKFFFGDGPQSQQQVGLGSGVIVSPEGYLLTNHHVVEDATEIEVQLADGRQARARVVGSDAETDIAVLKIELDGLPVVTLGDVRALQVGDAVLAIGNPFNVGQTVTAGIVSALDRNQAGSSPFQNFIQTDAAINPGNSGGALVDAQGHLVGINTAIFSRSGGSLGIGFAVPVDTARAVMQALLGGGSVRRGWIGVEPRDLSAELAESLNLPVKTGVLITGVLQDGPAARGGLRPGDVVLKVGDKAVRNTGELFAAVAALAPDSQATLRVQRGPQAIEVPLQVGERPKAGGER
ncbi:MAG: trypsin-like peptidase domain-containing protein [Rubrivivax sp.]|nr:trypsin-like peptidase domain-containing protein [Rubrivivax sp.]